MTRFEGFAQHLEHAAVPLRQFVEEQHACMRERDLARPRLRTAADQRDAARGVVRRAVRRLAPAREIHAAPARRRDRGAFERLVFFQQRQDRRQARGQHGLAAARRPDEQEMVRTGRGHFERTARRGLAAHVGQVRWRQQGHGFARGAGDGEFAFAAQEGADLEQGGCGARAGMPREPGLGAIGLRQHHLARGARRGEHRRQRAVDAAQLAGQRQFAEELAACQRRARQLPGRGEDAERDRQVETSAILGNFNSNRA
jgi:hypothetical protein